jgi:hypothetical protein
MIHVATRHGTSPRQSQSASAACWTAFAAVRGPALGIEQDGWPSTLNRRAVGTSSGGASVRVASPASHSTLRFQRVGDAEAGRRWMSCSG